MIPAWQAAAAFPFRRPDRLDRGPERGAGAQVEGHRGRGKLPHVADQDRRQPAVAWVTAPSGTAPPIADFR